MRIVLEASAELPEIERAREQLVRAISAEKTASELYLDLSSDAPPKHIVLQLLASAAATTAATSAGAGNRIVLGPRASSIVERMVRNEEEGRP